MSAVHTMISRCQILSVAFFISVSVVQTTARIPSDGISNAVGFASTPGPLDKAELSLPSSIRPQRLGDVGATPKTYIRTQSTVPPSHIAFKFLQTGPNSELLPIRVSAVALHAFYASIAAAASTIWPQTQTPSEMFTITQGALQLTMSGLGTVVPWAFVEDWALRAAESVMRGWTDTFDAGYEVEGMGWSVWVSLRLLDR